MPVTTNPPEEEQEQHEPQGQMSFLDHLEELRKRIINSLIGIVAAFAVCWTFSNDIFLFISGPIRTAGVQLNMLRPTEGFTLSMKLAFMGAVFLSSPVIMSQVWLFIAPGLYKHEKRYALPFIFFSSLLFVTGGAFGFYIAFPFALQYLIQWGRDMGMNMVISASEYYDLFIMIELALGFIFQIPAVIFVLSRLGLVSAGFLLKHTKYAILISFAAAAIITPTSDIPNMMIMAVPMITLYMLGIVVAFLFGKKKQDK